jgi:hypothetical protein
VTSPSDYTESITNQTGALVNIKGFVVLFFDASGTQVGSDSEPGGGYVDDTLIINMNDQTGSGQTISHIVKPDKGIPPGAQSCQVAQVDAR